MTYRLGTVHVDPELTTQPVRAMKFRCPYCSSVTKLPRQWKANGYTCPGCQRHVELPQLVAQPEPLPLPDQDEPPPRSRWRWVGKWALIAAGFHLLCFAELALVATIVYYSPSNRERRAESEKLLSKMRMEDEARAKVQSVVRNRLRAPTTAKFDHAFVSLSETDTDVYVVRGEVHAQNGFGAMIKSYYAGKVRRHSDEWVTVGETVISDNFADTLGYR